MHCCLLNIQKQGALSLNREKSAKHHDSDNEEHFGPNEDAQDSVQ
jgi:hypothetical protein